MEDSGRQLCTCILPLGVIVSGLSPDEGAKRENLAAVYITRADPEAIIVGVS